MSQKTASQTPVPLHKCSLVQLLKTRSISDYDEEMLAKCMDDESLFENARPFNPLKAMLTLSVDNDMARNAKPFYIEGYKIAVLPDDHNEDFIAIFDAENMELAAGLHWRNLIVRKPHQGRGIGAELLIMAFETGIFHPDTFSTENRLSKAGSLALTKAHRLAVDRAILAGKKVPPNILGRHRADKRKAAFREEFNTRLKHHIASSDDSHLSMMRRGIEFDCKVQLDKLSNHEHVGSKYPFILEIASNAYDKFVYVAGNDDSFTLEVQKEKILRAIYNFAFTASDNYMDTDSVKSDLVNDILSKYTPKQAANNIQDMNTRRGPRR